MDGSVGTVPPSPPTGRPLSELPLLGSRPPTSRLASSGKPLKPAVGKPTTGSTRAPTSSSMTKLWPPPSAPVALGLPEPAAVASALWVGSSPAAIACWIRSTSLNCASLGATSWSGAWGARLASRSGVISRLLSRPRVNSAPFCRRTATAPAAPVSSCSPANRRSPSIRGRRLPSLATAITWPITLLTTPTNLAMSEHLPY